MKTIIHIDFNYFFAQVEEILDPSIKDKPVAVGYSIGRGVISTCNYIARGYGVRSGMPTSQVKKLCPEIVFVWSGWSKYSEKSIEIFSYLRDRYPLIEQFSCDEAYIDISDEKIDNLHDYLRDLQIGIYNKFNIKVSIGCSFTKFLAKMASDLQKPLGLTILTKENYRQTIGSLPISHFYGIGKSTYPKLEKSGITTIDDLEYNPIASKILGNMYSYCLKCLQGISSDILNVEKEESKSCSSMHTFSYDTSDINEIVDMIKILANDITKRLNKHGKKAKTIVLTLRNSEFITKSKRVTLKEYTNSFETIFNNAVNLLNVLLQENTSYRLVGVGADNFFFDDINTIDKGKSNDLSIKTNSGIDSTIDDIFQLFNSKYDKHLIFYGTKNL